MGVQITWTSSFCLLKFIATHRLCHVFADFVPDCLLLSFSWWFLVSEVFNLYIKMSSLSINPVVKCLLEIYRLDSSYSPLPCSWIHHLSLRFFLVRNHQHCACTQCSCYFCLHWRLRCLGISCTTWFRLHWWYVEVWSVILFVLATYAPWMLCQLARFQVPSPNST